MRKWETSLLKTVSLGGDNLLCKSNKIKHLKFRWNGAGTVMLTQMTLRKPTCLFFNPKCFGFWKLLANFSCGTSLIEEHSFLMRQFDSPWIVSWGFKSLATLVSIWVFLKSQPKLRSKSILGGIGWSLWYNCTKVQFVPVQSLTSIIILSVLFLVRYWQ